MSVLCGHSGFSSPPQQPMISDFEGFSIPNFIHYISFPILILEKEPVFPVWMFSAKQGHYWYHFYCYYYYYYYYTMFSVAGERSWLPCQWKTIWQMNRYKSAVVMYLIVWWLEVSISLFYTKTQKIFFHKNHTQYKSWSFNSSFSLDKWYWMQDEWKFLYCSCFKYTCDMYDE